MVQPTSFSVNAVPVHVRLIDKAAAATFQDTDAREPVRNVSQAPLPGSAAAVIAGQVVFDKYNDPMSQKHGRINTTRGHFTMRQIDIDAYITAAVISRTPQTDDIITLLGKFSGLWYIDDTVPIGHYADQGGHTLMQFWFEKREPQIG